MKDKVIEIFECLNILLAKSDIEDCHRLGKSTSKNAIVRFATRKDCCAGLSKKMDLQHIDKVGKTWFPWFILLVTYLNVYTYRKLQKYKFPWYCLCCLKKEMSFCSLKNEHPQELMHDKVILSPYKEIITNVIRQTKIIDEELLRKANNKFFTPNEFDHALK